LRVESAPGRGSTFWFVLSFERNLKDAPAQVEPAGAS